MVDPRSAERGGHVPQAEYPFAGPCDSIPSAATLKCPFWDNTMPDTGIW